MHPRIARRAGQELFLFSNDRYTARSSCLSVLILRRFLNPKEPAVWEVGVDRGKGKGGSRGSIFWDYSEILYDTVSPEVK